MIIDEIRLRNFGIYGGDHSLDLSPKSAKRPIILISALNGSGKTTLLDAMQLALYGKLGTYSSRGESTYDEFLRKSMNRDGGEKNGSGVELLFRESRDGLDEQYRLHRSWHLRDGKVRESFEVFRNGTLDKVLSEHWYEYVDELLPSRIAPLFFFDGEKVVELADAQRAPELLRVAIRSLLGLDIVQQLKTDLEVLTRRKRAESSSDELKSKLEKEQRNLTDLENERDAAFLEQGSAKNALEMARKNSESARQQFANSGGDLFEQRQEIEKAYAGIELERSMSEHQLRELAAGVLPITLLRSQLEEIKKIDSDDRATQENLSLISVLEKRDRWLAKELTGRGLETAAVDRVLAALSDDMTSRKRTAKKGLVLDLSADARQSLSILSAKVLDQEVSSAQSQLTALQHLDFKASELERKLAAIPTSESIQALLDAMKVAEVKSAEAGAKFNQATNRVAELDVKVEQARKVLVQSLESEVDLYHKGSDAARMVEHASRAAHSLKAFEAAVVRRHISRLEQYVLNSFQTLIRKERLISRIEIDPDTFEVTLKGVDGNAFTMDRLSAGERQLLAVSLLWGLAQASGRPVPTVIDTPLGRLDSAHRTNLVEKYFPYAGQQVILLSTDTEITADHYARLRPRISRSYTLAFDGRKGTTDVYEGVEFPERGAA